jgi:hypothetical protein
MAQIITNNFNVYNAKEFIDNFDQNLYLLVGRPQNWNTEPTAPVPINTEYQDVIYWSDSIALRRIVQADIKQVVKRYTYSAGLVYSQYDNTEANLYTTPFYVLTLLDYNVYKCIFNNFGSPSTVKPTGKSTSIFETSDGYRWKYMYSLTDADLLKFLTNDYMPVNVDPNITQSAIKGTIDSIVITNKGNNYTAANIGASIYGNGTDASANSIIVNSANSIDKITISLLTMGQNYTFANVVISTNTGQNASARAIISPVNGHGSDPLYELGARYVMINSRLDYAAGDGDFPTVNDYRRIGIIKAPISNITSNIATELTLDSTYTLNLSNVTGTFTIDELLKGDNTKSNAFIVSANINSPNAIIRYISPAELQSGIVNFSVGETVRGNSSLAVGIIENITPPEARHNTGKFLYVENRSKITRQPDQAENVHIIIEF